MYYRRKILLRWFHLILLLLWIGCSGEGTLELDLSELGDSSAVEALVRVDGDILGPFDMARGIPSISLTAGVHVVGVDLRDSAGNIVSASTAKIIQVESGQIAFVSLIAEATTTPDLPIGRFRVDDAIFNFAEVRLIPADAEGLVLRRSEGGGTSDFGLLTFEDEQGNPTGVVQVSVEYLVKDAKWERDPQEFIYRGNERGTFFMYLGERAEGNVIFEGGFVTDPPDNLQAIIQPDGQLVQYELAVFVDAAGKGVYSDHTLKGTVLVECFQTAGEITCFISMDAEIQPVL